MKQNIKKLIIISHLGRPKNKEKKFSLIQIKSYLDKGSDVVMSDMAVNTTGIKNIDSIQTGELCKEAMIFSKDII